jgi:hypothetical protein
MPRPELIASRRVSISGLCRRLDDWVQDENGEITVAWMVLVAATVGLTIAVMISVGGGAEQLSRDVDTELTDREPSTF